MTEDGGLRQWLCFQESLRQSRSNDSQILAKYNCDEQVLPLNGVLRRNSGEMSANFEEDGNRKHLQ